MYISYIHYTEQVGRWRPSRCHSLDAGTSASSPPAWTDGAVFYNLRVEVFTPEGTFAAAAARLDYVKSLGVTAVLLLPVSQGLFPGQAASPHNNFYGVLQPDVIEPTLGGGAGFKSFVDACHR